MISEERNTIESRLASVDALRGFTMFWIIGGAEIFRTLMRMWPNPVTETIGQQMSHLNWGGFCFIDLIFPMFLFIVGVVLPFSISQRLARGQSRTRLHVHIAIRTGLLFLLGLIRDTGLLNFNWFQMRFLSVLSMIAISYFIAAVIVLNTSPKIQGVITGALLIGYCVVLVITGIEIPDDHKTLPSTQSIYCAYACAGTANVLIGALVGHWLGLSQSGIWKTAGLAATGLTSVVAGYIWGIFFPIIRIRWTSSFVLVACGYSLLLLAAFYWLIEVRRYTKWAFFFVVVGMNPITIYMLQKIVDFNEITGFFLQGIAQRAGMAGPLIMACGVLAVNWLLLWFLYQHKVFLKV